MSKLRKGSGWGSHRKHDTDYMPQWSVSFSSLQVLTRDESPSPIAEELQELEDRESQLDEWVELQVSGETSPPLEDIDQDMEAPTILWAGPAFGTVAPDELEELFPSASSAPTAQDSNNDTEGMKSDTEDVLYGYFAPVSHQMHVTLEKSQFIRQGKSPLEEEEMLEVKMLEKEMQVEKLVSQAFDSEQESVKVEAHDVSRTSAIRSEQSLTIVEAAEASLGLDLHQDSTKISKGGDFQDACSSFQVLHPIEELATVQGTL